MNDQIYVFIDNSFLYADGKSRKQSSPTKTHYRTRKSSSALEIRISSAFCLKFIPVTGPLRFGCGRIRFLKRSLTLQEHSEALRCSTLNGQNSSKLVIRKSQQRHRIACRHFTNLRCVVCNFWGHCKPETLVQETNSKILTLTN